MRRHSGVLSALVLALSSAPAMAVGPLAPLEPGFGGYFSLNLMGAEVASRTDVDEPAVQSELTEAPGARGDSLAVPLFEFNYTLANQRTQFYAGVPLPNLLSLRFLGEIGVRQRLNDQLQLQLAVMPRVDSSEVWDDPYRTDGPRVATDQTSEGVLLGIESPALSLTLGAASSAVDDERSGGGIAALGRDTDYLAAELRTGFPVDEGVVMLPTLGWLSSDADGEALSYDEWTLRMGLVFQLAHHRQLVLSLGGGQRDYDAEHPLFGITQRDELVSAAVFYLHPMPQWRGRPALTLNLTHENSDANIDFHDERQTRLIAGIGWQF